ncbi:MAG: hypothetical protein WB663_05880 [Beijerinckiaceae bacterium]
MRAYVHPVTDPNANLEIALGEKAHRRIEIKNFGVTPASDVFSLGNIAIREFPLIGELPAIPLRTDFSRTVIPPGETHEAALGSAQAISVNEWESVEAGEARLYMYGIIRYRDAFGQNRETKFRLMSSDPELGPIRLIYCPTGNEAS